MRVAVRHPDDLVGCDQGVEGGLVDATGDPHALQPARQSAVGAVLTHARLQDLQDLLLSPVLHSLG